MNDSPLPGSAPVWDVDLPRIPVPVHGCAAAADGDRVLVVGGTSLRGHLDLIQVYDLDSGAWQAPIPLPWEGRLMAAHSTRAGLVVCFEGTYCALRPGEGEVGPPTPLKLLSSYRRAGKAVALGDQLLVLGGIWEGDGTSPTAVLLDPATGRERPVAPMRIGRAHLEAIVCGDRVYVFGGRVDHYAGSDLAMSVTDTVERYDVSSDTWRTLEVRMPLPRMVAAAVRIGRFALLLDGQPRNDGLQMSSVWVFDTDTERFLPNRWVSPYPCWSGGAAYAAGKVYLAGGNRLVYTKTGEGTFAMVHAITDRFVSVSPVLPPGAGKALGHVATVY